MNKWITGGLAGLAATLTMSAVMFGGKAAGLLVKPPPKEITRRTTRKTGVRPQEQSQEAFDLTWWGAHFSYGVGAGVAYTLLRPLFPGKIVIPGLTYGGLLWAFSYLGIMPALGLYPWPSEDSRSRKAVMIAAHGVYGLTAAGVEQLVRED